MSEREIGLRN